MENRTEKIGEILTYSEDGKHRETLLIYQDINDTGHGILAGRKTYITKDGGHKAEPIGGKEETFKIVYNGMIVHKVKK